MLSKIQNKYLLPSNRLRSKIITQGVFMTSEELIIQEFRHPNEDSQIKVLNYIEYLKWRYCPKTITEKSDHQSTDIANSSDQ